MGGFNWMATLKRMREEAALTLDEVAYACGVRRQAVWLWEQGKNRPNPSHRRKLATVFHCTPREILEAIEEGQRKEDDSVWAVA